MPQRPSIRRNFFAAFAFVLVVLGGILAATWKSADVFLGEAGLVAESQETLGLGEKSMRYIMEMENARRGFIMTGNERLMHDYESARVEALDALSALRSKTAGRPDQTVRITRLEALLARIIESEKREIEERRKNPPKEGSPFLVRSKVDEILPELRSVHFDLEHTERAN